MNIEEYEQKFEELKALGQANSSFLLDMKDDNLGVLANLLNFISIEIGIIIRLNIEILKTLRAGDDGDPTEPYEW